MAQLNYHHLYYFYITVQEGSLAKAAERLHVTPQTVSGQIKAFEHYLGRPLFDKVGKTLQPNQLGNTAFLYAQDIFAQGTELLDILLDKQQDIRSYRIGVTDVIPKVLAFDLLHPVTAHFSSTQFRFSEGSLQSLLERMTNNELDLIISDIRPVESFKTKVASYHLGSTDVSFACAASLKSQLNSAAFPQCLNDTPLLIASDNSTIKPALMAWFEQHDLTPQIAAVFEDSALLKLFAQTGKGIACIPTCTADHAMDMYGLEFLGRSEEVKEHFFAISPKRFSQDVVLDHLLEVASDEIFN